MQTVNKKNLYPIKNPFAEIGKRVVIYDIEVYQNLFLVVCLEESGAFRYFTFANLNELRAYLADKDKILVGYNSLGYDEPILKAVLAGERKNEAEVYAMSQEIIESEDRRLVSRYRYHVPCTWWRSVDLMNLAFKDDSSDIGIAGLKDLAIRIKHHKIQDLPYSFDWILNNKQKDKVAAYCQNDVDVTRKLWNLLSDSVALRYELEKMYGVDVLTLSDAQVSEEIICHQYKEATTYNKWKLCEIREEVNEVLLSEIVPDWIYFYSENLRNFFGNLKTKSMKRKETGGFELDSIKETLVVGGKEFSFAAGGLHSVDYPAILESCNEYQVVDVDVTSYYPALIIRDELHPGHLTKIWTNILKDITELRIKAKREGKKGVADSLKIVINSAFGKTGEKHSAFYDPRVMYRVTISGQLAIIMLIERLVAAGIEVISANTDGIVVKLKPEQRALFDNVCTEWSNHTQLQLEESKFAKYVRRDVNNYMALDEDGKIKTKGEFNGSNLRKKNDRLVIKKAWQNYFLKGVPIEDTILQERDITNFCFSYKATRSFKVTWAGSAAQRTNRWYVSTSGKDLMKHGGKNENTSHIANGKNSALLNELPEDFPGDIDYDYYIKSAYELIHKIEAHKEAKKYKELGLHPIPKEAKRNPSGAKLDKISQWNETYHKYAGLGLYTGLEAGIVAIDLDKPEAFKLQDKIADTMTIWHSSNGATRQDVHSGAHRGTILYRCKNRLLTTLKGKKFVKTHGFELLYGKKTVQVFGIHTSGELYKVEGQLTEIPEELEKHLLDIMPKRQRNKKLAELNLSFEWGQEAKEMADGEKYEPTDEDKEKLKELASKLLPDHTLTETEEKNYWKLQGHCPYEDQHDGNRHTDFDIFFNQKGIPNSHCFHANCSESISQLNRDLHATWYQAARKAQQKIELAKIKVQELTEVNELAEIDTIAKALTSKQKHIAINAATGSGKTYTSADYFLSCLKHSQPVCFVSGNRIDQEQFIELLEEKSNLTTDDLYTQVLRGGENFSEETDKDGHIKISESTLAVVTHHTYLQRKGMSDLFYSFLKWIEEKKPIIIVDEGDAFCEKITQTITVGARYVRRQPKGSKQAVYIKQEICPAFNKSGGCHNCWYFNQHHSQSYEVSDYHVPYIKTEQRMTQSERDAKTHSFDLPIVTAEQEVQLGNLFMKQVQQHKRLLGNKSFRFNLKEEEVFDEKLAFRDMIDSAFFPTIYKEYPTIKGEYIDPRDITEEVRAKVKFPYHTCDVPHLSLKDLSPMEWIRRHAKKSIWLSATFSPTNIHFLKEGLQDLAEVQIEVSNQKIDELLVVGFQGKITYVKTIKGKKNVFFQDYSTYGQSLVFEPRLVQSRDLYKKCPSDYGAACYFEDSAKVNEKFRGGNWEVLITHSRGPLGRAINLPNYFTVFISANIYKPAMAYDLTTYTRDELTERKEQDRQAFILQNAGRILRGNQGRKVIVLQNTDAKETKVIAKAVKGMVREKVECGFYEHDVKALHADTLHFHETGKFKKTEKSLVDIAKDGLSKVTASKRVDIDMDVVKEKRKAEKIDEIKEKLKKLKQEGMTWTKVYRKLSVRRLDKEFRDKLKVWFKELTI